MNNNCKKINTGALDGLLVLDLGRMVAGPYCAMILANMGARVIKIEDPRGGDISRQSMPKKAGKSTYYINYNCSKDGITLNLKAPEGKKVLSELIKRADVLIENFRPGVMQRLGFPYEAAKELNPRIIYASISGYGQTGGLASRAAFDPVAQAVSGMVSVTGAPGSGGVRCGASIADILAGQNAAIAILAALNYRNATGRGQWIDIALADSCISALSGINQIYLTDGRVPAPLGNGFAANAPGNSYDCSDGKVMILAGSDKEWRKLAEALGCPQWLEMEEFADVEKRLAGRERLDAMINKETRKYTVRRLMDMLLAAGLPAGELNTIDRVAESRHFREARKMFVEVEHPGLGKLKVTNLPINMSETQPVMRKSAPELGENNEAVLGELGLDSEEIKRLRDCGAI